MQNRRQFFGLLYHGAPNRLGWLTHNNQFTKLPKFPKLTKKPLPHNHKTPFKQINARRTRSPPRSILDVCEQAGYRSATQQLLLKTDFRQHPITQKIGF